MRFLPTTLFTTPLPSNPHPAAAPTAANPILILPLLRTGAGTLLDLSQRPPPSPLPTLPETAIVSCPRCYRTHTYRLYNDEGGRRVAVCYDCFAGFVRKERLERNTADLTSFPSLLEEGEEEGGGQEDGGMEVNGGGVGGLQTAYGSLGRVFGAGYRMLNRRRKRCDSGSSAGSRCSRAEVE